MEKSKQKKTEKESTRNDMKKNTKERYKTKKNEREDIVKFIKYVILMYVSLLG